MFYSKIKNNKFNYWCFSNSVPGKSHSNEDYAISYYDSSYNYAIAIVCDGHGAEKHFRSEIGAKIAAEVSLEAIKEIFNSKKEIIEKDLQQISNEIYSSWIKRIKEHFKQNVMNNEEKQIFIKENIKRIPLIYGTTLNISVVTNNYWFAIKCGDGDIVKLSYNNQKIETLPALNTKTDILNITHSLCDEEVKIKTYYEKIEPNFIATFVLSDGITNSFDNKDYKDFLEYFLKIQYQNRKTDNHNEKDDSNINEFLVYISNNGSCDDASIAGIFNDNVELELDEE